jgi:hypothetical protein
MTVFFTKEPTVRNCLQGCTDLRQLPHIRTRLSVRNLMERLVNPTIHTRKRETQVDLRGLGGIAEGIPEGTHWWRNGWNHIPVRRLAVKVLVTGKSRVHLGRQEIGRGRTPGISKDTAVGHIGGVGDEQGTVSEQRIRNRKLLRPQQLWR